MILIYENLDCLNVCRLLNLLDLIHSAAGFLTLIRGSGCPHVEVHDLILLRSRRHAINLK